MAIIPNETSALEEGFYDLSGAYFEAVAAIVAAIVGAAVAFIALAGQYCAKSPTQISAQVRKPSAITVSATLALVTETGVNRTAGSDLLPVLFLPPSVLSTVAVA